VNHLLRKLFEDLLQASRHRQHGITQRDVVIGRGVEVHQGSRLTFGTGARLTSGMAQTFGRSL
jgi:hypothetical protein